MKNPIQKSIFLLLGLLALSLFCNGQETKSQLVTRFDQIRNETVPSANTKARIANAYQELADGSIGVFPVAVLGTDTYTGSLIGLDAYAGRIVFTTFENNNTGAVTVNYNSIGAGNVQKLVAGTWTALSANDIKAGELYRLYHDGTRWQLGITVYGGTSPTTVTVGGLTAGTAIAGKSYDAIIQSIVAPYVNPLFTAFSISGQATTVEVGTTLSGSKTFTWSITLNSGAVSLIDLYDNTAVGTLLSNTANDGTQAQTITTIQLNSNGATQSWKGILHDTNVVQDINSSNFVVTGRFIRFFGATSSSPANSAAVRALPSSAFHTGATTFTLATGNTLTKFVVALPPSVTISTVIDTDALGADITSQYILTGTVNVTDAGGTSRAYNIYEMNIGVAYGTSHNHSITTAN